MVMPVKVKVPGAEPNAGARNKARHDPALRPSTEEDDRHVAGYEQEGANAEHREM